MFAPVGIPVIKRPINSGAPGKIMIKLPKIPIKSIKIKHNLLPIFSDIVAVRIEPRIAPKGKRLVKSPA